MPDQLAFEFGLLNTVASVAGAIAAIRTEEGLAITSGGKSKPASDNSFRQKIHVIKDVHENHQLFFFSMEIF